MASVSADVSCSLSDRGRRALRPLAPYFAMFAAAQASLYDSTRNPQGYICMSVAENNVSDEMVRDKITALSTSARTSSDVSAESPANMYDSWSGRRSLRAAFQHMAERRITRHAPVDATKLHVSAGCGSLIEHLGFLLLDAGDCVLLPTPSYGALWNDFGVRANVRIIDVPMNLGSNGTAPANGPGAWMVSAEQLDAAAARAVKLGFRPKMLFVINPNNPLGVVYSEECLRVMLDWAATWRPAGQSLRDARVIHCVVDEVYALSTHNDTSARRFVSAAQILHQEVVASGVPGSQPQYMGSHTHVLWGFSKDFCLGGARCGVLFTHNRELLQALDNTGYFSAVCNMTQDLLARLIADDGWMDAYLQHNRARLSAAYAQVSDGLRNIGIPFVACDSGFFVWMDLSSCCRASPEGRTFEDEQRLTDALFQEERLLITPGQATHHHTPGWYRMCYAWTSAEGLSAALQRLKRFFEKHTIFAHKQREVVLSKM